MKRMSKNGQKKERKKNTNVPKSLSNQGSEFIACHFNILKYTYESKHKLGFIRVHTNQQSSVLSFGCRCMLSDCTEG